MITSKHQIVLHGAPECCRVSRLQRGWAREMGPPHLYHGPPELLTVVHACYDIR
jgi:hypothetical protein